MVYSFSRLLLSVVFLGVLALALTYFISIKKVSTAASLGSPAPLTSRYCDFYFSHTHRVSCYYYWTEGKGGGFKLPIALIQRKNTDHSVAGQLLIRVPGGPGQGQMATGDEIAFWVRWLDTNDLMFDLLLYDPRGTSEGSWRCRSYNDAAEQLVGKDLAFREELTILSRHLRKCLHDYDHDLRQKFARSGAKKGLGLFSSHYQANDIDGMAKALGYDSVHLWGTSYGGRVALLAARYTAVKSLLLDSPYIFEQGRYAQWPQRYAGSFALHERAFSRLYPQASTAFSALYQSSVERLSKKGHGLVVKHWVDNREILFFLNGRRLLEVNFFALYSAELLLPYYEGLRHFAMDGVVSEELRYVIDRFVSSSFDQGFNNMAYFATECIDNQPESIQVLERALKEVGDDLSEYFSQEWQYNACGLFDFPVKDYIQDARYSDKPTLVFGGELDPITPLVASVTLLDHLSQSRVYWAKTKGHAELLSMECDWAFLNDFIANTDVDVSVNCQQVELWP